MNVVKMLAASALLILAIPSCDDGGDGDGTGGSGGSSGGCGLEGRDGITPCSAGLIMCQAGQYCVDDLSCEPGCTSDQNCAANEFCSKGSGEAVGVCARCMAMDAGAGGSPAGGDCAVIAQRAAECGLIAANEEAAFDAACVAAADPSTGVVANCVRSAGDDCAQVTTCVGGGGPGGAGGGGGGCQDDADCDQTPGIGHQICSGGLCAIGCREDADCGNDFVCDTDFGNTCTPDDF